jgi:phosphoglycolate phosphatase-like HAD superfamily hydrolase
MENLIGFCFDLDGTLINTTEIGAAIEKEIYNEFDLEVDEETEKEIDELTYEIIQGENRNNLGRKVMWEIFKVLGLNFFQRIKALYISSKIFKEEIEKIHLFDGVEETFTFLEEHSIPYSIATTSSQKEVEDRLTKFPNFYKKVQGKIITRSDVKKLKPHQESLLKASKIMNVPPTRVVMVGDMHHDVLTGKNVNAITVAVLTGIFSKEKIYEYEPDFIIESVADIPKILDDIKQKINEN